MSQSDWTFPHDFKCEWLAELPQPEDTPHLYFPRPTLVGGADGALILVKPRSGRPWIGTFANGDLSHRGVTGTFSMPDPNHLCVVARGRGYLVPVDEPTCYLDLEFHPILDVRVVPKHELIVFANFTELLAYDTAGFRWRTERLSWNGLKIKEVDDNEIRGEFWDIRSEQMLSFVVDLRTGGHSGGAQFT